MFPSRTALTKHLVSAEHRRLTVICPWCPGEEKSFTKISDLKVHVKSRHKALDISRDRFSRSSGFYFAVYPKDYSRIVDHITAYESDVAYSIRKAVRAWAERFSNGKERIARWNEGWKEGLKMSEERSKELKGATERKGSGRESQGGEKQSGKRKAESAAGNANKQAKVQKMPSVSKDQPQDTFGYDDDITIEEAVDTGNNITGDKESQKDKIDQSKKGFENMSVSEGSSSSSSSSDETTGIGSSISNKVGGIRARAYDLLKRGAMPLLPPGRRDWTTVKEFQVEYEGKGLSWPPTNWRALTADQRLLAREHASTFIELRKSTEFPTLSRRTILDMYLFLGLDGEGRPQEEDTDSERMEGKIRQYNYAYLKGVATGIIPDSRISWGIVKSIEKAERWTDTDTITDKLDSWGIKLKL